MISQGMTSMRVVISEGNTAASRAKLIQTMGWTSSELLARLLKHHLPYIEREIVFPSDPDPKSRWPLEFYDDILFTGSTSNIHKRESETLRQLDFVRVAFYSGTPMFGICWRSPLAALAAGGEVALIDHRLAFAKCTSLSGSKSQPAIQTKSHQSSPTNSSFGRWKFSTGWSAPWRPSSRRGR